MSFIMILLCQNYLHYWFLSTTSEVYKLLMSANISSETFTVFWNLWLLEGRPSFFIRKRGEYGLSLRAQLFCREEPENMSLVPPWFPDTTKQRDSSWEIFLKGIWERGLFQEAHRLTNEFIMAGIGKTVLELHSACATGVTEMTSPFYLVCDS